MLMGIGGHGTPTRGDASLSTGTCSPSVIMGLGLPPGLGLISNLNLGTLKKKYSAVGLFLINLRLFHIK